VNTIFDNISKQLTDLGFQITRQDLAKPWGGYFAIDEAQAKKFASHYFAEVNWSELQGAGKLSPKVLMVAPQKRLSWQYHDRRAEIWKCISGVVEVITSDTDKEETHRTLKEGEIIRLRQGERHRLIGLQSWGIVAEIWQHTDANHFSDESDIVRVADDFSRR
jgi:mannose-6-phosphate isomerase-like protein (cupin superfamily)